MTLPRLSIAAKLYTLFAILAVLIVALALTAVVNARRHAALADDFQAAFTGAQNVQKVNSLIYAVVMESRGVYMSPDISTAKKFGEGLLRFVDQIGAVVKDWRQVMHEHEAAQFEAFAKRIQQFQEFRRELVRRAVEVNPAAGREWGDNDANRNVRTALNKDIETLAQLYADRSQQIYAEMDQAISFTALMMAVLGTLSVLVAGCGALIIWRLVAHPLAEISQITAAVAAGSYGLDIPYGDRKDEIGDLARSVLVFRDAAVEKEHLQQTSAAERNRAEEERHRNAEKQAALAAEQADVVRSLGEGLGRLARGDLSFRLTDELADSYRQIKEDFNIAITQLEETIRTIVVSTEDVANTAAEIAGSTTNLSQRTEEQAADRKSVV